MKSTSIRRRSEPPLSCRGRRLFATGRFTVLACCFWAGAASAQTTDVYDLSRQVSDLQQALARLQEYVYRAPPAGGRASGGPIDLSPAYRGRIEVRLSDLEDQLRNLTGRVEEVTHLTRTLQDRLDKLVADVDFRLTALERAAPGSAGERPAEMPAPIDPGQSADRTPTQSSADQTPAGRDGPPRTTASLPSGSTAEAYQRTQQLLAQGRYGDAEAALRSFIEQHPEHELVENARYWLGETYYVRKRYEEAASTFLQGYKEHPTGSKAPDNLLKLGLSLGALDKDREACVAINKLLREHPDSPDHIRRRAEQEKQALNCT